MLTAREASAARRFVARRRRAALLRGVHDGYADLAVPPDRGVGVGVVCTVLTVIAAAIYVWFARPSLVDLPDNGVVEIAQTGATYLMIDGVAHPTLNTTSARLAADESTTVNEDALEGTPRGAPVGIPGAPDQLPSQGGLTDAAWAMCTAANASTGDPTGDPGGRPVVVVGIGTLAALPMNQAVLLRAATPPPDPGTQQDAPTQQDPQPASTPADPQADDADYWLVVNNQRHQVGETALAALGITTDLAVPISESALTVIPQASPLAASAVPEQIDAVVAHTSTVGATYYAVAGDALAPLTPLAAALLTDGPPAASAVTPTSAPVGTVTIPPDWPSAVPQALELGNRVMCATAEPPYAAALTTLPPAGYSLIDDPAAASAVAIAPGTGAIIQLPEGFESEFLLVTDAGVSYDIEDATALRRLGFQPEDAVMAPQPFIDALPRGPRLSVELARTAANITPEPGGVPTEAPTLER